MKKKLLLTLIVIMLSSIAFGTISISAETYGDLTYTISNGEVAITGCNTSATGEISIPDTLGGYPVTSISSWGFENCSSLTSVTIPATITKIDYGAFENCSSLTSVHITDIISWCSIDFGNFDANPLYYAKSLYLNGNLVANLALPDGIKEIKDHTFSNCDSLLTIDIPDTITTIGNGAFSDCDSLKTIDFSDAITIIGYDAFSDCDSLIAVDIPHKTTSIGSAAFSSCDSLTSITIPESVTRISNGAFSWCGSLTQINWNAISVDDFSIRNSVFEGSGRDNKGINVVFGDNVKAIPAYCFSSYNGSGAPSIISVEIGNSVTAIGYRAFYGCDTMISITLGNSVTSIADEAFAYCSALTSIIIPDGVTSINNQTFCYCKKLTSITIPKSITSIGGSAFYKCSSLTRVNITDFASWYSIDFFNYDSSPLCYGAKLYINEKPLTDVILPNNAEEINSCALRGCTSFISITFGNGTTNIPESTFLNCSELKYICFSQELLYIQNDAFNGCSSIETVFYEGGESQWNEILIYNRNESLTNAKVVYNATKKTYKFETNCGIALPEITNYAIFTAPVVNSESKNFIGWYDNVSLSGEPVTFPYYGNATTLYAAWTDRTGKSFDDALVAKENQQYTVTTTESGQIIYYEFVPKYTGEYRFYSIGNYDTYGYLYNSSRNPITYNDDAGDGNNFHIDYELTAGEIYYIGAKVYSGTGTFTLYVETDCVPGTKTVCVTASSGEKIFISIPNYLPENSQVILACYKNDKFVEMETAPNKNETIYYVINNEFDTAKVMVWESFENIKPLCEVETVQ